MKVLEKCMNFKKTALWVNELHKYNFQAFLISIVKFMSTVHVTLSHTYNVYKLCAINFNFSKLQKGLRYISFSPDLTNNLVFKQWKKNKVFVILQELVSSKSVTNALSLILFLFVSNKEIFNSLWRKQKIKNNIP